MCGGVYDHPSDFPGYWVVRRFSAGVPTHQYYLANTLHDIRTCVPLGKTRIARAPADDPVIVESWI